MVMQKQQKHTYVRTNRHLLATFSSLSVSRKPIVDPNFRVDSSIRFIDFWFFRFFDSSIFGFFDSFFSISVTVELHQCRCNETDSLSKSKNRKNESKNRNIAPWSQYFIDKHQNLIAHGTEQWLG